MLTKGKVNNFSRLKLKLKWWHKLSGMTKTILGIFADYIKTMTKIKTLTKNTGYYAESHLWIEHNIQKIIHYFKLHRELLN